MNYKYTLVNYLGSDIDFSIIKTEMETSSANSYCTHPDLAEYRSRNIPMRYHYFGSDGVFIGDFEVGTINCAN